MNDKIYDINFKKLVTWLVPERIAKATTISWLLALVSPVFTVWLSFKKYRTQKLYELYITPQVCYLERLLNDKYDYVQRRIVIDDPIERFPTYIFKEAELKPVAVFKKSENHPIWIYTEGEAGALQDDFIILVPKLLKFSENEMMQLVKGYRLAGMKAKIQRV